MTGHRRGQEMKRGDRETRGLEMETGDREDEGTGDGDRVQGRQGYRRWR